MKFQTLLCIFLASLCIASCSVLNSIFYTEPCPYIASTPEILCTQKDGISTYAHASFELYNNSSCAVEAFICSFCIYDEDNAQTLVANNTVTASVCKHIPAYSKEEICISLDDVLYGASAGTYTAEHFYVLCIEYADGSVWEDTWGMYAQ